MSQTTPYFKDIRARIRESEKQLVRGFMKKPSPAQSTQPHDIRSSFDKVYGSIRDLSVLNGKMNNKVEYRQVGSMEDLVKDKTCPRCLESVEHEAIYALGRLWHITHFYCGICKQSIVNKRYFIKDMHLQCLACCEKDEQVEDSIETLVE